MVVIPEKKLVHYGILRRSGRYPWGSGGEYESEAGVFADYLRYLGDMRRQGVSPTDIAKATGITTTQLRAAKTIALAEKKLADVAMANSLAAKGMGSTAAARQMGIPEPTYRSLLKPGADLKARQLMATADLLQKRCDEKTFVDVGHGNEVYLHISKEKLQASLDILKEKGYEVHTFDGEQAATGLMTKYKVLCPPGTTQKDAWLNRENIQGIQDFTSDGGETWNRSDYPPISISSKRIGVRYKEDGGDKADGVIYVKEGVEDISLGGKRYAQVRIKVDDGHYLKGMAMYRSDMDPNGPDLIFNTNKSKDDPKIKKEGKKGAMKELSDDPDLPFGAMISRQVLADAGTSKERNTSAMNIVNEEGDWDKWAESLSSQMLSKQSPALIRQQLILTQERRQQDFDDIMELTNPIVRKKLLEDFADNADSAAVHLKSAGLPGQAWNVILPFNSIKPTEIYAPNRPDGERVALVRYPHGGTFEIPELIVNNKNREARRIIGTGGNGKTDAVGIHPSVAERLSGADFDGDTVLVIPNNSGKVKSSPALQGLIDFDPRRDYKLPEGAPKVKPATKQALMGDVSNLITDMTLQGATTEELARAVRHSMVVIDCEKHHLNHKLSAERNGIGALKEKYQGGKRAGAATLISRKKKKSAPIPEDKLRIPSHGGPVDRETGQRVWEPTNATRRNKDGERVLKTHKVNLLDRATDAHTLSSGTPQERLYADHSNRLKAMANQARLEALKTARPVRVPGADKVYKEQVTSLLDKLAAAERNAPRERLAQAIAGAEIAEKRRMHPEMEKAQLKKVKYKAQAKARLATGASKQRIKITSEEWNAIQAGAISNTKLEQILRHADMDLVRQHATPKAKVLMTANKTARAKSMLAAGFTRAEVAAQLGVSLSTLDRSMVSGEGGGS